MAGSGPGEDAACRPTKDFIRNIANHVLSEAAGKLPLNVFNEIKNRIARAEDKYRFTIYGGDPRRLVDYLDSDEWRELAAYAKNLNADWVLARILEKLIDEYKESCPIVSEKAREVLDKLRAEKRERHRIAPEAVMRMLKMHGYKAELREDKTIYVEGTNFSVEIEVVDGILRYKLCRIGRADSVESIEAKIEKIREI